MLIINNFSLLAKSNKNISLYLINGLRVIDAFPNIQNPNNYIKEYHSSLQHIWQQQHSDIRKLNGRELLFNKLDNQDEFYYSFFAYYLSCYADTTRTVNSILDEMSQYFKKYETKKNTNYSKLERQ